MMEDIDFAYPELLYLLLVIPVMGLWYWRLANQGKAGIQVSSFLPFTGLKPGGKIYFRHVLFLLRAGAVAALIVCLARPQSSTSWENRTTPALASRVLF